MKRQPTKSFAAHAWLGLLPIVAISGCSTYGAQEPTASRSVIDPARSDRGNPAFYEVLGERYYVLPSSDGYRERGVASWYGRDFQGKRTSSGEPYDMYAMTAAHKTLPIPTWVEVTNLRNDKSVIVKINDRGPFVGNRVIDLSYSAAQRLDMIRDGTARVQVRALGTPGAVPDLPVPQIANERASAPSRREFSIISEARADTVGPGDLPFRPLYVQVGAFANRDNAVGLVATLKRNGFQNSFVLSTRDEDRTLHKVRIGPLDDAAQFDRVNLDLRSIGLHGARLVNDN